ncbi:MAG: ribose-phosphate diphosphokinase [Candidatus Eisenbacteria bacterium]|nr:ribose-phosphate diphosphokinase [Candidatus Latescibacterota bacterium]MBD3301089.1 ribose-phosphate diphosphokinase [Candidatus Eisenbacteria bacterium]
MRVFTGNANRPLAAAIATYLGVELGDADVDRFGDGEITVKINENVRGCDMFIVQPTFAPGDNLLELLIMMDAARRASAERVTAVLPYFGYARQDRKDQPRVPITAKLVANLITTSGANRVLTMDLHSAQIQGFFDIPFDHLFAAPVLIQHFRNLAIPDLVVVAPDVGSIKMARAYSKRLGCSLALVDKRRTTKDQTEVMNVIGEVKDRNVVIFDDLISTGGTIAKAARALRKHGVREIFVGATHAAFNEETRKTLEDSPIREIVVTDTIPQQPELLGEKVRVLSVSKLLGEAIRRIHEERSLSSLFI